MVGRGRGRGRGARGGNAVPERRSNRLNPEGPDAVMEEVPVPMEQGVREQPPTAPPEGPAAEEQEPIIEDAPETTRGNDTFVVTARRRQLELEEEEARLKYCLIQIQKERLRIDVSRESNSSRADQATSVHEESMDTTVNDLTHTLNRTLSSLRRTVENNDTRPLINRLASKGKLQKFSGNNMEWLRFKNAYIRSTETEGYTDQENVNRLYNALEGEAKTAVESLMMTAASAEDIMKTLELRFGNKEIIAKKLAESIRKLPKLNSAHGDIVTFATTVQNCVTALQSLNHVGYLHNPDLLQEILLKLPSAIVYRYNDYSTSHTGKPALTILSEFLYSEAERANSAGTVRLRDTSSSRPTDRPREPRTHRTGHVHTVKTRSRDDSRRRGDECNICKREEHPLDKCQDFLNAGTSQRWVWARKLGVCFGCLKKGHRSVNCKAERHPENEDGWRDHPLLH